MEKLSPKWREDPIPCQKSNPNFRDIPRNDNTRNIPRIISFSLLHFVLYLRKTITFGTVLAWFMLGVRNFYLYFLSADDGCNMYLDFFRNNTKLDVDLHSQIVKLMSMEKEKIFVSIVPLKKTTMFESEVCFLAQISRVTGKENTIPQLFSLSIHLFHCAVLFKESIYFSCHQK